MPKDIDELNFVASIAERDIDLLFLEEISVSTSFQTWIANHLFEDAADLTFLGAWHSVSDAELGESDLLAIYLHKEGGKVAALIEDKINAPRTERQAARYKERGRKGVGSGSWASFVTCLLAPDRYVKNSEVIGKVRPPGNL